jgi:hypothetical protein
MGASTSYNSMGLYDLLQGWLYLFTFTHLNWSLFNFNRSFVRLVEGPLPEETLMKR